MIKFKKQLTSFLLAGLLISAPLFPSTVNSPKTLGTWLYDNFTYELEEEEHWKSPKEMVKDKSGDCEDFAILAQYVLKKLGYKAYLIVVEYYYEDEMHAICVFRHEDGTYSYYSNEYYEPRRYKSVRELLSGHSLMWKNAWVIISKNARFGLPLWRNKK